MNGGNLATGDMQHGWLNRIVVPSHRRTLAPFIFRIWHLLTGSCYLLVQKRWMLV